MPEINVAVVGCGYWGKNLVRNFHQLGALAMICDGTEAGRVTAASLAPGVPVVAHLDEVLARPEITALVIATPAETHYTLARQALSAGRDVFVEKPLCLSDAEGQELLRLATEDKRILMVGHLLHYHPCVEAIQSMVQTGKLGKIYAITSNRLNLGKIRQEENALWSFAPHDLSVILSLTGNALPRSVACTGGAHLQEGICDTTLTAMSFAGGIRAHVHVSWLNPFKEQKLTVVGSKGMVVFDDTKPWEEKLLYYGDYLTWNQGSQPVPNKSAGEAIVPPQEEPLRKECVHFLDCCVNRSTPKTDGAEGLRVLNLLNLAQQSLESGGMPVSPKVPVMSAGQKPYFAHPSAIVDEGAEIGEGSRIWHWAHVSGKARIGKGCSFGQNVFVGNDVVIGNNCKVQNNVSIYDAVHLEDDVFCGPSMVFTNVYNPRSAITRKDEYRKTLVKKGATLGANCTIVCGITIGEHAFIGAGAVVNKDVKPYALMVGVPARQIGWMSRYGEQIPLPLQGDGKYTCPHSQAVYRLRNAEMISETS